MGKNRKPCCNQNHRLLQHCQTRTYAIRSFCLIQTSYTMRPSYKIEGIHNGKMFFHKINLRFTSDNYSIGKLLFHTDTSEFYEEALPLLRK